ncbi:MAG: precorrin-8X methylmutase [Oscillospiraceae bacterium]|nr:precorrin-8X methylmutase [Oscillospiraceae bacterium]
MTMPEHYLPSDIERTSFSIIRQELKEKGKTFPEMEASVVFRCIHATADFDYADLLHFSDGAISDAVHVLQGGCTIVTDTNMALAGISKVALKKLGCEAVCYMAEPAIAKRAEDQGITRAASAMDHAKETCPTGIRAVGNAPTALFRLADQIEQGLRPALIIAAPVGFVNVVESKNRILTVCRQYAIPIITVVGRKGGSTVCTAICNALLYEAAGMTDPSARGWN